MRIVSSDNNVVNIGFIIALLTSVYFFWTGKCFANKPNVDEINIKDNLLINEASYRTGETLFQTGKTQTDKVMIGDSEAPASLFACKNCHGTGALGISEGGFSAPDIRWHRLIRDSRVSFSRGISQGEKRAPYNRQLLHRLLTRGIDSNNQPISHIMPRYALEEKELDGLIVYLKKIDAQFEQGVESDSITIGLILPNNQTLQSQTALLTTQAYFREINRLGGIFRRKLFTVIIDSSDPMATQRCCFFYLNLNTSQQQPDNYDEIVAKQVVISLFTNPKNTIELSKLDEFKQTAINNKSFEAPRYEYSLYANYAEHARWLVNLANNPNPLLALKNQSKKRQFKVIGANEIEQTLDSFQSKASKFSWPILLINGNPTAENKRRLISYPTLAYSIMQPTPDLVSDNGIAVYRRLANQQTLPRQQLTVQFWSLALTRVLENVLQNSGAALSSEKVIRNLNRLYQYSNDFGPAISFVAGHRTGASGGFLVQQKTAGMETMIPRQWIKFTNDMEEKLLSQKNE